MMAWRIPYTKNAEQLEKCRQENKARDQADIAEFGKPSYPEDRWTPAWHGAPLENLHSILSSGNVKASVAAQGDRTLSGRDGVYCYKGDLRHKCAAYSPFRDMVDGWPRAQSTVLELQVDRAYRLSNAGLPCKESKQDNEARLDCEAAWEMKSS
jgi:hypothetical protein